MRTYCIYIICMLLCIVSKVYGQETTIPTIIQTNSNLQATQLPVQDTIPILTDNDLAKITSIRSQFEKQNRGYTRPVLPNEHLLSFLQKDQFEISEEARYWINYVRDPATLFDDQVTYKDTAIVNPLFLPLVFRGSVLPDILPFDTIGKEPDFNPYEFQPESVSAFKEAQKQKTFEKDIYAYMRNSHPSLFKYSERDMPQDIIKPTEIKKPLQENLPVIVETDLTNVKDMDAPIKFIPERQYWQSGFESSIQFSQSYISPNWYKGGTGNLNLYTRNYLRYDYKRDKVKLTNEMELKVSFYTAPKDTLREYRMGDDLLRLHSNFGYQAFNKWYYSFDAEFKTQLFNNYPENSNNLLTSFFSPFTLSLSLGMQYDLDKKFKDKHKSLKLNTVLAPFSTTIMYNYNDKVDLSRFGFKKKPDSDLYENTLFQFGFKVTSKLNVSFNRNVSLESRFQYFSNYHRVEAELENRLDMAISRFFSTTINLYLRFDDGVTKKPDYDSYFQINELMSFGFKYKW